MTRLQAELQRLYLPPGVDAAQAGLQGLAAPDGRVSAMVLELAGPASWEHLAKVWHGAQSELELPAPAIAVSGADGYQLWFSLAEPVPGAEAAAFLEALRRRYLGEVPRERIAMVPHPASASGSGSSVTRVPPAEAATGRWSAFVAPDLAALFADEPWIDLAPSADAQADLLSRVQATRLADFHRAVERLRPVDAPAAVAGRAGPAAAGDPQDPRQFLLEVMNDRSVELRLRIEAAKALLPFFHAH